MLEKALLFLTILFPVWLIAAEESLDLSTPTAEVKPEYIPYWGIEANPLPSPSVGMRMKNGHYGVDLHLSAPLFVTMSTTMVPFWTFNPAAKRQVFTGMGVQYISPVKLVMPWMIAGIEYQVEKKAIKRRFIQLGFSPIKMSPSEHSILFTTLSIGFEI
ncbi:MAG: hypothetical protein S4CHLAM102_09720 [Chlamydiia bacterium]|nr:hypothetical protein [Chlamydiia bacterium]